jgi:GPI mannosyltransferase 2
VNNTGQRSPQDAVALAGLVLAHGFHLFSCFMLYGLSWNVYNAQTDAQRSKFAFVAACIHIISPAGLFLSVPYAESAFSFFNFTGFYLYMKSLNEQLTQGETKSCFLVLTAGLSFGMATILRSNGLLSGLLFLCEISREILEVKRISDLRMKTTRLGALIGGGSLMAACAIGPQFLAYLTYCVDVDVPVKRQWCTKSIPSIYGWVQSYYW